MMKFLFESLYPFSVQMAQYEHKSGDIFSGGFVD